ncbi:hypothetical protein LV84_02390 [Algoriphagus ratkowskyi]|uniref:Uncharacterized protein n=1 Tax=Algoriphagus ratkowskyi TaxID=57028 RepID=A0A2W7RYT2_9BACT|nr:hypothetical protein [Algoriphagus ratkowskyi]PZX56025.1 hypothetical protein LV84_02390 [Algoriphagus ratkowskyi]TXD77166.1 hypothetical protein ESW18_12780 [Algoriphagus ratkowskyi]
MKNNLLALVLIFSSIGIITAQSSAEWKAPMYQVSFESDSGAMAQMQIDKGYRYADLDFEGRKFHLFFNHDNNEIKNARIMEPKTNLQIARGRGSYFWGNARFEFVDGEVYKVKRKNKANGYEIIGPYGTLFKVENHAISPVKPINEKDFLTQAFYVFQRIKVTQSNPSDVMIFYSNYYPIGPNE